MQDNKFVRKHAYLIMAHTDAPLLATLIAMLDDERNDIYLHVDRKWRDFQPDDYHCRYAQLYILKERIDVRWGHYSIIDAELLLFSTAYKPGRYSYYHLLSGADLPIKTQDVIHDFFARHAGKEFISYWQKEASHADARYKMERYALLMKYEKVQPRWLSIIIAKTNFILQDVILKIYGVRRNIGIPRKGANWLSITEDLVSYVLDRREAIEKQYQYVRNGDEIFIQSLVYNSPFRDRIYSLEHGEASAMRHIVWANADASSPNTYTIKDKEELFQSEMLFARKFSTAVDAELIRLIYERFTAHKA